MAPSQGIVEQGFMRQAMDTSSRFVTRRLAALVVEAPHRRKPCVAEAMEGFEIR